MKYIIDRLDRETLGSQPLLPKISPDTSRHNISISMDFVTYHVVVTLSSQLVATRRLQYHLHGSIR